MPALTARDTAHRLIASESAASGSPPDDGAAAERVLRRLSAELTGWFGPFGTHALITRALAHARVGHPSLGGVTVGTPSAPAIDGLADSAHVHGEAGIAGAVALLAWIIELLGRLIGDELATLLINACARHDAGDAHTPRAPRVVGDVGDTEAGGEGTGTMGDTTGSRTDD